MSPCVFMFEIFVEELKSFTSCKEFCIRTQFADIFSLNLNDLNELESLLPKRSIKSKHKTKVRYYGKTISDRTSQGSKVQQSQSVIFTSTIDSLISNMKQYPMELSLSSKIIPDYKIGSTNIPWSSSFIEYLNKQKKKQEPAPVCVKGDYNVFDEFTSKRMAVITLNTKLSFLKREVTTPFEPLSEDSPQIFNYTSFNKNLTNILSTIKDRSLKSAEEPGILKTVFDSGKRRIKKFSRDKKYAIMKQLKLNGESEKKKLATKSNTIETVHRKIYYDFTKFVKSDTNLDKAKQIELIKSKSCSSVQNRFNVLNYIFGGSTGPFGNKVYCVGYFTVEDNIGGSPKSNSSESPKSKSSESPSKSASSIKSPDSAKSAGQSKPSEKSEDQSNEVQGKERYKFKICDGECPSKKDGDATNEDSVCSLDLPMDAAHLISLKKCDQITCDERTMRHLPIPPDDRILLDLSNLKNPCCDVTEKVEEVVGGMKAKMKFADDPCYCECECRFGFMKKTTYCSICGGYEVSGDDQARKPGIDMPFPCPIFHKLADKGKMKTLSATGSDTKRDKSSKQKSGLGTTATVATDKSFESEKEKELSITGAKKSKKKKKDDRFKFNYGYSAPMIGHSHCAMPCTGTLGAVPKNMGWLWNAEDVPGIKHRPHWKPGAANKHVVRLLKIAKNPGEVTKKRKRDLGKVKRPLKRPLLVVHKKDGEYTVTMETMKTFTKPRTFNQYPYEDKPLVTYTIGRTEEENRERRKKKERARRRLERLQREFIQSTFRNMCEEICLKTYQQALGILPDAEHPECPCYPAHPGPDRTDLDHSCSCSEDKLLSESDTDSDEWIIEFTPPTATFDPAYKGKKVAHADSSTQYTYLDYRVKLVDRYGNPVPRFFKGPDGTQQCSDLGGFWGPNKKWLEINTDGYIGPDEKWAPNSFVGPDGETIEADGGKFLTADGEWLVVGVDGYIDVEGKWKFYPKPKPPTERKKRRSTVAKKKAIKHIKAGIGKQSEGTWSCFGSVSPKQLSKMGIVGHGQDKKLLLSTLQDMLARGEDVKIPEPKIIPRTKKRSKAKRIFGDVHNYSGDIRKCKHATPSTKGIIAVDGHGHKTYFRLKDYDNKRPKQRIVTLTDQGISISTFHVPCFHSFISSEIMKKQQYERRLARAKGDDITAVHKSTSPLSIED